VYFRGMDGGEGFEEVNPGGEDDEGGEEEGAYADEAQGRRQGRIHSGGMGLCGFCFCWTWTKSRRKSVNIWQSKRDSSVVRFP